MVFHTSWKINDQDMIYLCTNYCWNIVGKFIFLLSPSPPLTPSISTPPLVGHLALELYSNLIPLPSCLVVLRLWLLLSWLHGVRNRILCHDTSLVTASLSTSLSKELPLSPIWISNCGEWRDAGWCRCWVVQSNGHCSRRGTASRSQRCSSWRHCVCGSERIEVGGRLVTPTKMSLLPCYREWMTCLPLPLVAGDWWWWMTFAKLWKMGQREKAWDRRWRED